MKAELWSNGETMGEGVRGEGSAVTVFFSLSLAPNLLLFSVEFGARVSLKHTKKTASYEHYLLF